jgi:hypothetical protein
MGTLDKSQAAEHGQVIYLRMSRADRGNPSTPAPRSLHIGSSQSLKVLPTALHFATVIGHVCAHCTLTAS